MLTMPTKRHVKHIHEVVVVRGKQMRLDAVKIEKGLHGLCETARHELVVHERTLAPVGAQRRLHERLPKLAKRGLRVHAVPRR